MQPATQPNGSSAGSSCQRHRTTNGACPTEPAWRAFTKRGCLSNRLNGQVICNTTGLMTDAAHQSEPRIELFEIEDLATLEVLIDPLRLRVVNALIGSALTVKEIAGELGVATTRLYYHVNMLVDARLIEVVDTEKVGASIQRRFRSAASEYSPAESLARLVATDRRTADTVTSLVLEGARVDADALLAQLRVDANHPNAKGTVGRVSLSISPGRVEYWLSRLAEVVDEIGQESEQFDDTQLYGFSFVLAPLASPLRAGAQ